MHLPEVDPPEQKHAIADFLELLLTTGEVVVPPFNPKLSTIGSRGRELLAERDAANRLDLGLSFPTFNDVAAEWAARQFFLACQLLVCRDVPAEVVSILLGELCPTMRNASTDYSVDLVFQFLPDLFAMAARLEPNDPFVAALKNLAQTWPLSSVGIPLTEQPTDLAFAGDSALMRLYADRVTERDARDRLNHLALREYLRADAGLFPDLLPFPSSTYTHD